ncbi:MAG: hypothetical protein QM756_31545 [Polyangiaceae bacterium]
MSRAPCFALLLLGCAGPALRGATSVAPESEPRLRASAPLTAHDCRDERGASSTPPRIEFVPVDATSGPRLLLERRPGHDTVLIQNSYDEAGRRVYAYVSNDAKQPALLHRIELEPGGQSGRLDYARPFVTHDTARGFNAVATRAVLRCQLSSRQRDADAAHGDAGG